MSGNEAGKAAIDPGGGRPADAVGRTPIENIVILAASPLRVWSVITDFAGHPQWKPFTQLAGEAICDGLQ